MNTKRRPYLEVQLALSSGSRILRLLPPDCDADAVAEVCKDVCRQVAGSTGECVTATTVHTRQVLRKPAQHQRPRFTNLCGRVQHASDMAAIRPDMKMLFIPTTNVFGHFLHLSHVDGNLVTSTSRNTTLFRGGKDPRKILELLREVLDFDRVSSVCMHMCVCAGHLGKPVRVAAGRQPMLDDAFLKDSFLTARIDYSNEEMSSVKVVYVDHVHGDLCARLLPFSMRCLRSIVIHIGSMGFINMIVVMNDHVELTPTLDTDLQPLFAYFFDKIDTYT